MYCFTTSYQNKYSGWRVFSKSGSGATGIVTLIHAGTPECYRHGEDPDTSITNLNNRANSQYVNSTYASSARSIVCGDASPFGGNACSGEQTFSNDLIVTGVKYWFATKSSTSAITGLKAVSADGETSNAYYKTTTNGFRPIVTLKAGVQKTGGSGTSSSAYNISI